MNRQTEIPLIETEPLAAAAAPPMNTIRSQAQTLLAQLKEVLPTLRLPSAAPAIAILEQAHDRIAQAVTYGQQHRLAHELGAYEAAKVLHEAAVISTHDFRAVDRALPIF